MTFTEAALEVLRLAGEPLHYKKITELAIERNLLSHVGKTPEVTMSSRLAMMVKKDRGQAPIIKVKPGVFAIRESALLGASLSPEALAAISEVEGGDEGLGESKALEAGASISVSASGVIEESLSIVPKAPHVPSAPLPGSDVFPEEEGDDDPILAGLEQESEGSERSGRRRRRRRRRKGDKPETTAPEPISARADNTSINSNSSSNTSQRERFRDRPRPERSARSERPDRGNDRSNERVNERVNERSNERVGERPDRNDRNERNDRSERNARSERSDRFERPDRGQDRSIEDRGESRAEGADANLDWNRQPADGDLLGKDLADAVSSVMARGDRTPHTFARVAELLVRRGRLSGSPAALAPTIAAAVRADIARSELNRARPRFRLRQHAGGIARLSLSDWHLPKGLQRSEQDLLSAAERYAGEMRRALIQKLSELPTAGFAELLATWLNAEGVTALRAVRRPGSSGSEFHFAGTRKTGSEEVRLAIVVQRGGRDIDREGVTDVRGALHHYGQAQAAWIVTLGRITSGAREESGAQAAACALFDGNALVAAMERLGVAIRRNVIMHHEIDYDLLESLGDSPEQRERREREQERERREHNERNRPSQQQRGRGGREPLPPRERGGRGRGRDEVDADGRAAPVERPVKLRDADWDDEVPHEHVGAAEGEGVSEAPAPRAFALHDADSDDESSRSTELRDELDSERDEHADEEDFSTHEEHDENEEHDEADADEDSDADDDSDDEDDVDASTADDSDDSDDADDADEGDDDEDEAAKGDEDFRAAQDDSDAEDDDAEDDESDDDAEGDDEAKGEASPGDEGGADEEKRGETAERGRRR